MRICSIRLIPFSSLRRLWNNCLELADVDGHGDSEDVDRDKGNQWILFAVVLGFSVLLSLLLEIVADGIPLAFTMPFSREQAKISTIMYYLSIASVAAYVGYVGLRRLIVERRFSVEVLMATAAFGAAYLGFLFEGATVLFLYSLAEYFEGYIEDRARKTVQKLATYMPDTARVIDEGAEKIVDVKQIHRGTAILIRAGERIPLDGTVAEGSSFVDESLVTGESIPVRKKRDDVLYAGTLNMDGVLKAEVSREVEETLVSRIVRLIMLSKKRKASMERLVDRFARVYVPAIIALALFTILVMPTIAGGPAEAWIYRSLIILVVSCPSAFILSVPATFFTAIATAARKGVIIKGAVYIEKMDKVRAVVFDKTGTLTLGKPAVRRLNCLSQENDQTALLYAAALERYSNHPLAQSIVNEASERNLEFQKLEVKELKELPGKGVIGLVNGCRVCVGNKELMKEMGLTRSLGQIDGERHTRVFVSIDQCRPQAFCMVDEVRSDAASVVDRLRRNGIYTAMLTGDKSRAADEVAEELGMNEIHSELLPEDKLEIVARLREKHGPVAMVGDGINDAPALAASDVGIAMSSRGVDVALESADIVLVKDELNRIPYLQRLSKLAVKIAKQNITISLGVKLALGTLGFLGFVPLWFAVAAGDDGVTMLLFLNSLRLPRLKTQLPVLT